MIIEEEIIETSEVNKKTYTTFRGQVTLTKITNKIEITFTPPNTTPYHSEDALFREGYFFVEKQDPNESINLDEVWNIAANMLNMAGTKGDGLVVQTNIRDALRVYGLNVEASNLDKYFRHKIQKES